MPRSRNGTACRAPNLMEEFSRPATLEDLKLLLRSLNEHGADYLLIGGYALAAHGYQRATIDIDVLVPGTVASGQRIKEALMVLPDQAAKYLEPEWFEEGENIRVADAIIVDLLLNANGPSFDTLCHNAETIDLDGIPVKTISLEGLLLAKQTMRDKDAMDRILIERALNILKKDTNNLHDTQTKP
jgi:predicted nucleotidyltransferase